MHVLN
jgi:hypothetical protein